MRVFDANTGIELHVGITFTNVNGTFTVVNILRGWFSASIVLRRHAQMDVVTRPLRVRWTHPQHFLRHVAFLPS
jgi:hypothetical protein